ncbi:hypothetical protein I4U23_004408 [Adineta vaga]|nr:hypothetical protein I4U23_004408 [Adineta vaga]
MFYMKCFLYFICLFCVEAVPQLNLYFTDQVSVNQFDEIGVRYNCIRFASNLGYRSITRDIASFCMSESSSKFSIENDNDDLMQKFSFDDLAKQNITSEELYLWSISIDTIEQYQYYLETNDSSLRKQFVYNCTLPRFGPMCQYELYYYHENYTTLYELIHGYYQSYPNDLNGLSCYTHLKCHRGYQPACLDWTEICDGKIDCLDGNYDEEHCWQLELNECELNEYQCTIGQCIPNEFVQDNRINSDCLDRSDEKYGNYDRYGAYYVAEPVFGWEDAKCKTTFLTSSCELLRSSHLIDAIFSIKDNSISNKCWFAFKCYFGLPSSEYPKVNDDTIRKKCISTIRKECSHVLYVPNIPLLFGHIYTAYKKDDELNSWDLLLPYLCSNKSFHDGSLELVSDMSLNNTLCFVSPQPINLEQFNVFDPKSGYVNVINNIFHQMKNFNPIINFPSNRCHTSNLYQCINSSKCIGFHRLIDDISDCPYHDDENIFEDTNPQLFARLKDKYYHCYFSNKYIPKTFILDEKCDCGYDGDLCEDEDEYENFTRRTISFQILCDNLEKLFPITIDNQDQTDETECEQWECDNIYTHCDGVWNCRDGKDEIGCDISSTIFNCSLNTRICVRLDTFEFTCLPIEKINDGQVDCLGGTDEPKLCPGTYVDLGRFYCMNSHPSVCISDFDLCNNEKDCPDEDDEQFCLQNRSISMSDGICQMDYLVLGSDIEKFFCEVSKTIRRTERRYFRINDFNQSWENELDENEVINTITLDGYYPIPLVDKPLCHRGLNLRVWLNQSLDRYKSTCLCPPSYYGNQCQYQNQRLSLAIRFNVLTESWQIPFTILVLIIDNTNQRIIHSYEQFTYLSLRDCKIKFNLHLFYATRPKDMNRTYSIHIDIYEKYSQKYRGSFRYPVKFLFLPVHRLAFIVDIPSVNHHHHQQNTCSDHQCQHGKCIRYVNEKETFCQCDQGWSGQYCHIQHHCSCSANSLCIGMLSDNRSICVCSKNQFGSRCYLRNRICEHFPCQNNGSCVPNDDFMVSNNQKYICICSKGFSGAQCEIIDNQLDIIFDKNIHLSHSVFIHFIRIIPFNEFAEEIPKTSPQRSTTLQAISQATNSIKVYWSQPFHLAFIETLEKIYYLTVVQPNYNISTKITKRIDSSHRCPSISELTNKTFAQLHVLRRMKSYHSICQQYSSHLLCFHDDLHLCICYDFDEKRLANCFNFDHEMKFDCFGRNGCENDGQCFQDSPECPKRFICACRSCYYGSRCQFSTSEFGLSLDAILAYHIISDVNLSSQTTIVKVSFSLTIVFLLIGMTNGILSLITFKNRGVREVGCGIYLFGSSLTTLLTMTMFGTKYFLFLFIQTSTVLNQSFLNFQCSSLDFFLRICLNMDQWLNACVAMERAITVIQGARFNKKKSKELAKKVLFILLILIISTSIHDPIYRRLFEEKNDNDDKKRIWCIVTYSLNLQIYNRIVNTFHFFAPFLINFISSIILITKKSHRQSQLHGNRSYKDMLRKQVREHQHLLIAPVILFILALPRLILSYVSKCMNSTRDSWLFLSGYFISFIPPMITFLIFVLPSKFYRNEYRKSIVQYQNMVQQRFRRTIEI